MATTDTAEVIGQLVALIHEHYVFPEVAAQVGLVLTERLAAGRYPGMDSPDALAAAVTEDLQSVNGDRHLRLMFHTEAIYEGHGDREADLADVAQWARQWSAGFPRAQRLRGNVGYLEARPVLFPPSLAGDAVTAAMTLLADTDALIIDLRQCVGGDPTMVNWLCSYLFDDEPVELSGIYDRPSDRVKQAWTLPYVPGRRYGAARPLWVLTSGMTFSGGEAFSYDLQQAGRATVVGERTGGGAHPRRGFLVNEHLEATIPVGRAVSPVTGSNWEGTGVAPDIAVPAADAPATAYRLALEHVVTLDAHGHRREVHEEAREALDQPDILL